MRAAGQRLDHPQSSAGRDLASFQIWMAERHGGMAVGWPRLILFDTFGDGAGEEFLRTDEDHQAAIMNLCLRLREFLDLSADDPR